MPPVTNPVAQKPTPVGGQPSPKTPEPNIEELEKTPEVPDVEDTIEIDGITFTILETQKSKKGRGAGGLLYVFKPVPDYETLFKNLSTVVGAENWNKLIYKEVVKPLCSNATDQAILVSNDGKVTDENYIKALKEGAQPKSRRTGVHVADIREKRDKISEELSPLLLKRFSGDETLSEGEHNRMLQLIIEQSEVNKVLEKISVKGKKKGPKANK